MVTDKQKLTPAKLLDLAILGCLFAFAFAAPHSIAGGQTAWLVGMTLWVLRFIFRPRPKLHRTPVDYLLLGFFIITDRKSTRLNSSHSQISYAVFCLKKKKKSRYATLLLLSESL